MGDFEDWGDGQKFLTWKRLLLIGLCLALIISGVYAVYKITSPAASVVVTDAPELETPTFNATALFTGETLQITCHITPAIDQVQVFFYENGVSIGSAYTNSQGDAIINRVMNSAGTFEYYCDAIVSP